LVDDLGGYEPWLQTKVLRKFVAEELGDLVPTVAPEKMRHQRLADAVVLVFRS
jgi:hypothetical protein